jgi:hypothetical protein
LIPLALLILLPCSIFIHSTYFYIIHLTVLFIVFPFTRRQTPRRQKFLSVLFIVRSPDQDGIGVW